MFAISTLGVQAACYSLEPSVGSAPARDTQVAMDINDAGRVALANPVAPEIARIQGRLVTADSSEYVLAVTEVRTFRGGEQVWAGEPVHIKREWVGTLYQQHFSVVRTTLLAAAAGGAVVLVAEKALQGFATPQPVGVPSDSVPSIRIPLRGRGVRFIKRW